jgi:hypothetical protein
VTSGLLKTDGVGSKADVERAGQVSAVPHPRQPSRRVPAVRVRWTIMAIASAAKAQRRAISHSGGYCCVAACSSGVFALQIKMTSSSARSARRPALGSAYWMNVVTMARPCAQMSVL